MDCIVALSGELFRSTPDACVQVIPFDRAVV